MSEPTPPLPPRQPSPVSPVSSPAPPTPAAQPVQPLQATQAATAPTSSTQIPHQQHAEASRSAQQPQSISNTTAPVSTASQTQPTQPLATTAFPTTPAPLTFRQRLFQADPKWPWKYGLRLVTIVVGLIGIGCVAWALSTSLNGYYSYEYDDYWVLPWPLITFGISVIWSTTCILVFLLRRPNAPVHPGCAVGIDLILWLAFIPTALFAITGVMSVMDWGSDGIVGEYSSYGYYQYVASNNTWVYEDDSSYSRDRDCNGTSSSGYGYNSYYFQTCEEQDAYVNSLWKSKDKRFNTELTGVVCQFISLLVHFVLFVWACVDTHRRNSRKVSADAERLAADIVMNMVRSGAVVQAPGTAQCRPGPSMGYSRIPENYPMAQMYPPQQHPQQYPQQYPQGNAGKLPQQWPLVPPQAATASSSDEKSQGPRYA